MKSKKVVVTAAITGAVHVPSQSPYLPITPDQIVEQAVGAWKAGAAVVHIHARVPETGEPSSDLELMRKIVTAIKAQCDVVICITTGASQMMTVDERLLPIPDMKPELASCNAGSVNFVLAGITKYLTPDSHEWERRYLEGTRNNVFTNTYLGMERYISTMQENGTRPEFEVYDVGMINNIAYFKSTGLLQEPIYIQFVMGIQGGLPASVDNLAFLRSTAERQLGSFNWSVAGAGRSQLPMAAASLAMGGNVRVGLEDNLYLAPGKLAKSSAEQVEAVVRLAAILGKEIASPDEAREILGLKGKDKVHF
ncbi:3-keto-5-aminohexanoate cleavage enzyme [bioreactor metagenome]|uniref:3-keto-5-aminohexanoate cleavage enzyme n=1 Tax=bioreactor metagenome TaxID=1076179 RepID=A0A645CT61_9ZZZZ